MRKDRTKELSVKANMIYNTVGTTIYNFCIWLASVLIVKLSGFADAGLFSLAITVTNAPAVIALFNMRNFQASDLNGEYTDRTYITSRAISNLIAFVICTGMIFFYRYDLMKSMTILAYMMFKIVEGVVDVYHGIDQRKGRMDYVGISLSIRGIGSLVAFLLVFHFTSSLLICFLAMTLVSIAVVFFYDRRMVKPLLDGRVTEHLSKQVFALLLTCLPLAVVYFLNSLSMMIPRLTLEKYFGQEVMGYYSSVSTPTIVVQVAAGSLIAPLIPVLTRCFRSREKRGFLKTICGFYLVAAVLTLLAVVLAYFFGDWLLTAFFGEGILPYVYLFIPILLMSVLIAVNATLFAILTLMRIIRPQYVIGIAGFLAAIVSSLTIVKTLSVDGVVWATMITTLIQIGIQIVMMLVGIRRQFGGEHEQETTER